jgi:hypothetical protein
LAGYLPSFSHPDKYSYMCSLDSGLCDDVSAIWEESDLDLLEDAFKCMHLTVMMFFCGVCNDSLSYINNK